ncbi:hypothetical protein [Streptomyces sp. NPDC059788]|uniref:hypothetical protein n=1 Tax=Streptomyces sp. NPDC059788 TaxID=3346948 RepID=UPI003647CB68
MTEFADEARTRLAHLLRMAGSAVDEERARITDHVSNTPDPPLLGPYGIRTASCPRCRWTMWEHRDVDGSAISVCSRCGHVQGVSP